MTRLHIGLIENRASTELRLKVEGMFQHRQITKLTIFTNKYTGESIISLETDLNEIIDFLQNSGGRILTNEEYEALTSLSKGDAGSDVMNLQMKLSEKGYYPYLPSRIFDEDTELAVKEFQRANGLPVTGIANEETREKLTES